MCFLTQMKGVLGKCSFKLFTVAIVACLLANSCDKPREQSAELLLPEEPLVEVDMTPEPLPIAGNVAEPIIDKGAKVSILGYHQFISRGTPTDMRISVSKFHEQMKALHEAEIPVIPLADYVAWRKGEKQIPRQCVVITIDDGFKDLFTEALVILKKFGYPFTFYVYTNFLGGSGRTLSDSEVRALIAAGGELGSHSISHDFLVRARKKFATPQLYEAWLLKELKISKEKLEKRFGVRISSFAYPYGEYNDQVIAKAVQAGYSSAMTVNGAKAGYAMNLMELPRYIIHGNNDLNWRAATSFNGVSGIAGGGNLLRPGTDNKSGGTEAIVKVWPEDKSNIADRKPTIWADISRLGAIAPDSLVMKVSGFGRVPFVYYPERGIVLWDVSRALRTSGCMVSLTMRRAGEERSQSINWSFTIDRDAYYLPGYREKVAAQSAAAVTNSDEVEEGGVRRALRVP